MNIHEAPRGLTRRQLLKAAIYGLIATAIPVKLFPKEKIAPSQPCRCGRPHDQHLNFDIDEWAEAAAIEMRNAINSDILKILTGELR